MSLFSSDLRLPVDMAAVAIPESGRCTPNIGVQLRLISGSQHWTTIGNWKSVILSSPQSEKKILIFYKMIQFCIVFKIPEAPPEFDRFRGPFSKFRGASKSHPEFFCHRLEMSRWHFPQQHCTLWPKKNWIFPVSGWPQGRVLDEKKWKTSFRKAIRTAVRRSNSELRLLEVLRCSDGIPS